MGTGSGMFHLQFQQLLPWAAAVAACAASVVRLGPHSAGMSAEDCPMIPPCTHFACTHFVRHAEASFPPGGEVSRVSVCNEGIYNNCSERCRSAQRLIHWANGNMCATHGDAWTEREPRAAEAHGDLATNNLHTSLTHTHTRTHTMVLYGHFKASHNYFGSQVYFCVCH